MYSGKNNAAINKIKDKLSIAAHVEKAVLFSDKKVDGHVSIDLNVEKLEGKSRTATYMEIKAYVCKRNTD